MELEQRERKVDISNMSLEQVNSLSEQLSGGLRAIIDEAAEKINKILAVYGASAKIAIAFNSLDQKEELEKIKIELPIQSKRTKKSKKMI